MERFFEFSSLSPSWENHKSSPMVFYLKFSSGATSELCGLYLKGSVSVFYSAMRSINRRGMALEVS